MGKANWVKGDFLASDTPAHSEALKLAGAEYLTKVFRLTGSISNDNRVTEVTEFREVSGGSTGKKSILTVEYERKTHQLHNKLFVKFSRDFDDPYRDASREQMKLEVQFALLSRDPSFPINVPVCYFADYHHDSGTGILITQRIPFGVGNVEKLYPKALDYKMPDQLEHYKALITSLAKLAGTHKSKRLPAAVEKHFPFDPNQLDVSVRKADTPESIRKKVLKFTQFIRSFPQLFPENLGTKDFLIRLEVEAPKFISLQDTINPMLLSKPDMVALCHWNAHVDNAWFWKGSNGKIECGLMDWGNVSQMNVSMAIWGCLSAAESPIWNDHLLELLELFASEYNKHGGALLSVQELRLHLNIYVAKMGLAWMLDMPVTTLSNIPDLSTVKNRFDSRIENNEQARAQLVIMIAFLNLWEISDMKEVNQSLEQF